MARKSNAADEIEPLIDKVERDYNEFRRRHAAGRAFRIGFGGGLP